MKEAGAPAGGGVEPSMSPGVSAWKAKPSSGVRREAEHAGGEAGQHGAARRGRRRAGALSFVVT